jgi:hypothetical protein
MQNFNGKNSGKNIIYGSMIVILVIIILIIVLHKPVSNWISANSAHITSYDNKIIDISNEPVQELYKYYSKERTQFEYTSLKSHKTYEVLPVAYYKISGMVIATNSFFPENTPFDDVALFDIGIVWSDLANKDFFKKNCSASSMEYDDSWRMLHYNCKNIEQLKNGYTYDDMESQISHTHLIPANTNIKAALYKINRYENVELEGKLVDILFDNGEKAETSIERDDDNGSSSGDGACEIMYLTKVKIGNRVYE